MRGRAGDLPSYPVRKLPRLAEPVAGNERHYDVDAFFPRRLDKRLQPGTFQLLPHDMCNIDHVIEPERGLGIDIEEEEIRRLK